MEPPKTMILNLSWVTKSFQRIKRASLKKKKKITCQVPRTLPRKTILWIKELMVKGFRLEADGLSPHGMPWRLLRSHHPVLLPYTPGSVSHCSCQKNKNKNKPESHTDSEITSMASLTFRFLGNEIFEKSSSSSALSVLKGKSLELWTR